MSVRCFAALALALAACTGAARAGDDRAGIAAFLAHSAAGWNRGDLATFMQSYERSPDTVYISADGIVRGYAAIRAHYAAHYGKSAMGTLGFSDLSVRSLSPGYAVALAHWHLALAGGKCLTGPFSLLLRRSASGWHIIEDCTP